MSDEQHCSIGDRVTALEHAGLPPEEMKEAVKEAITEWLDVKFAAVGKWTVNGFLAAIIGAALYFILLKNGWKHD